jgi:hypothetical protein
MTSKSKIKGSTYERDVAKFLTEHYGETFIRNISGSGAYVGGTNSFRKARLTEAQIRHAKGDVVPPDSFKMLNIECKSYGSLEFHQLLTECRQLEAWLQQLMDASDAGDVNILFIKITRRGQYIAVQATEPWATDSNYVSYHSAKLGQWMIYSHDTFFKLNSTILKTLSNTNRAGSTTTLG